MSDSYTSGLASAMDTLAGIAYQFGPFFFAVLFTLIITRTARKWYSQASATVGPEHEDERRTYRTYFRASYVFGMFLVAISVGWWIASQWRGHHAFAGTIVALNENQALDSLSSDQNFWSKVWDHSSGPAGANLRDYWFVVVMDRPLHRGEKIRLNYWEQLSPGAIGAAPPPTAMIEVPVLDPAVFPQKYQLVKHGQTVEAVPY
jgi:hypothetical protein